MAIISAIRSDLRRILLATPNLVAGTEYKWEGKGYSPVIGTPYIDERIDPVSSATATLGNYGDQQERAVYALDYYLPSTLSQSVREDAADAIRQQFWSGRQIGSAAPVPMWGNVTSSEARPPLEGDGWIQHPVRVVFFWRRPTLMP